MYTCTQTFICVCMCVCLCTDVSESYCYLIKALKPAGAQHPHTALELKQRPSQSKCKQLRATSVSIRQTDNSCEQGL